MSFRKNGFSYFIWIVFAMCNLAVVSFLSMLCAKAIGGPVPVLALGIGIAFFGLLFLIYFLTGRIFEKTKVCIRKCLILEGILAVLFLSAGVGLRIYLLPTAGETAAYYEVAKVTQDAVAKMAPVQSSVSYYLQLLRGLFYAFGNHWIAGIWLQIALQLISSVIFYFTVRKLSGWVVSLIVLAYQMFAPSSVRASLLYSPDMLYLLMWSAGFLLIAMYLSYSQKGGEKESIGYSIWMWLAAALIGVMTGYFIYLDISGILFVFVIFLLPAVLRNPPKRGVWIGRMFLALLCAAGGFAGSIYLDGIFSRVAFYDVLGAWAQTFQPQLPELIPLLQSSSAEVMVLLLIMSLNIFSFFRRKDGDRITLWLLMTFILAILYVLGFTTVSMNARSLLLMLMCVTSAVCLSELFQGMPKQEVDAEIIISEKAIPQETAEDETQKEKPRFIENPLPLPKKHVKRTMDYAFMPETAMMKYDVETSENDDYDV